MNSSVVLLLLCLMALTGQVFSTAISGESAEQSRRRHSCGGLVEEHPKPSTPASSPSPAPTMVPTPAPGECVCTPMPEEGSSVGPSGAPGSGEHHCGCVLVEAFYNFSIYLTVQQQVIWEAWIVEIETTILVDVSLSSDEKVVQVALALKKFFSLHADIALVLEYKEIADWGNCRDFVYVAISIQIEITQSVVTLNGANSCPLLEALKNSSSQCGCSSQDQTDLEDLIAQIEAILGDASYTYEQQLAVVWDLFQAFFESHASLESFLLEVKIEGFGSVESLLQVCHEYKLIVTLNVAISGSTVDDCALLAGLDAASKNSSFTASEQLQIAQLLQKLQVYFQSTVDLKLRLEYVSTQCYQMFKLEAFIVEIIEQVSCGEWGGDIYDIIFCSGICTNHGCGNPNNGPGPKGTTMGPSTPSSSSSSSAPSTSTVPPTTTQKPADCSKCPDLIVVDGQNKTILTNTIAVYYNAWPLTKKSGFNTCYNRIRQAIWNNVNFPTSGLKLAECRNAFKAYSTNNVTIQDEVFNWQITEWYGTIRQFVACP